jgi:hypothetical protein
LAAHLALASPEEAERALAALQNKLGGWSPRLQNIYWNLLPQWIIGGITPEPADRLGQIVLGPVAQRQLDFDLHQYEPGVMDEAVRLARWTMDGARRRRADAPIRPILVPPPGREADLARRLQTTLCRHLNIGNPRRLADRLKRDDAEGNHLVLLLDPAEYPRSAATVSSVREIAEPATFIFLEWQNPPTPLDAWPCIVADRTLDDVANSYESCATQLGIELYADRE